MTTSSTKRLRVTYLVPPSEHFAGIERVVHEIASGIAITHGDVVDVHVLFCTGYDDELLKDTPYTLHVLGVDRLRNLPYKLRRSLKRIDSDVVICAQVEFSVITWLATRGLRLPLFVVHLHGNPRIEEGDGSRSTRLAFGLFRHVVSRGTSAVLAVSPALGEYAGRAVTRHAPVLYAKNPVRNLRASHHEVTGAGRFKFLNVGRLSTQKGHDNLLRALAIARPHLPPSTLTIVGSGPDESMLRHLSSELRLDDMVNFLGYVADPAEYFRSADCFVLSSRWEGFGMVLLEALQFGVPLLAADCEFGPADLITDDRIGELVKVDDPGALASGLIRAANCAPNAGSVAFRKETAAAYSRDVAATMHFDIIMQLVEDNREAEPSTLRSSFARVSRSTREFR